MFCSLVLMTLSFESLAKTASHAQADEIMLYGTHKDPIDGHWLPNLTGLPPKSLVRLLTIPLMDMVFNEKDKRCKAINPNLRMLMYQHFVIHQYMANAQGIYFDNKIARNWAHILAMILKESSGDSASVTDMKGRSISTFASQTNIQRWEKIMKLAASSSIPLNYQTNFGLTQMSADRLFIAFQLMKNQNFNTEFLEGNEYPSTPRKVKLNSAIAIRRLIWFYQDFAQGRVYQSDKRIHQRDINKPEFSHRYQAGLDRAILYCGTRFMFAAPPKPEILRKAMAAIAYCKLGNAKKGYGKNEIDEKCFALWVTLCPALNIDIAILTPLSYFETRGEKPICEKAFEQLTVQKPSNSSDKP